jgi:hypothetical protein
VFIVKNENINNVEKEIENHIKGYFNTNRMVLTALAAGAGLYLLGRSKGVQLGYSKGLAEGYSHGVSEVAGMVKKLRSSIEE